VNDETSSEPRHLLDEVLPRFDVSLVHEVWVPAPPHIAVEAVKRVTVGEVRLLRPLEALRTLPRLLAGRTDLLPAGSAAVLDAFTVGVVPLGERAGAEIAAGAIGRFWRLVHVDPVAVRTREEFVAFDEPGYAKAAIAFLVRPERGGSRVITETRVLCTSPDAKRAFVRYWRAIRLGSSAIRRSWLAAIRRRAVRTGLPGADSLLTVQWRDRSFVLRAPEQVEELAQRLGQKGLADVAVSIRGAVAEGTTGSEKALSDEEREAVCAVLTDTESDPALRRAFNLLCAEPGAAGHRRLGHRRGAP
jgi:hypothetical protein